MDLKLAEKCHLFNLINKPFALECMEESAMTNREKVLSLMQGKPLNELIWAPRMKLWHDANERLDTMPEKYKGESAQIIEI